MTATDRQYAYLTAVAQNRAGRPVAHVTAVWDSGWGEFPFRTVCSCGRYRSRRYAMPGLAEKAGGDHEKAKELR